MDYKINTGVNYIVYTVCVAAGAGAGEFQFQSHMPRLSECRPRAGGTPAARGRAGSGVNDIGLRLPVAYSASCCVRGLLAQDQRLFGAVQIQCGLPAP